MRTLPHRAAVTVVLLELDYAQAYAVDKYSVDAEGALIAPTAANVETLWFPVLDLVFLPYAEIMPNDSGEKLIEVSPSVLANVQNDFVYGVRKRSAETKTRLLLRVNSAVNFEIPQPRCEIWCGKSSME